MPSTIKKTEEILEVLNQACARKELLMLATPFLRFESTFLAFQDRELHVLATMSREDALFSLQNHDLKIRFPFGLGFYEASTRMLGFGLFQGKHTLRLTMPKSLVENDQRVAYRVERVGRITVTFSSPRNQLHTATLGDISVTGARLHADHDIHADEVNLSEALLLSVPLSDTLRFDTRAVVRHLRLRTLGVEFVPSLPKDIQEPLSRWVFLKREEERERIAKRLELALPESERVQAHLPARGILLLSQDAVLEQTLQSLLADVQPLHRLAPSAQAVKEGLASHPVLVIVHVPSLRLDDRRHLRALAEPLGSRAPVLLLGTDVDGADLFEFSGEIKASSAMVWHESRSVFLHRLVQGIIRRHRSGGDSPVAPREN